MRLNSIHQVGIFVFEFSHSSNRSNWIMKGVKARFEHTWAPLQIYPPPGRSYQSKCPKELGIYKKNTAPKLSPQPFFNIQKFPLWNCSTKFYADCSPNFLGSATQSSKRDMANIIKLVKSWNGFPQFHVKIHSIYKFYLPFEIFRPAWFTLGKQSWAHWLMASSIHRISSCASL